MDSWSLPGVAVVAVAVFAATAVGCREPLKDPTPFLGSWTWDDGAEIVASCSVAPEPIKENVGGAVFTIRPGTDADLELELGCYCRLRMELNGSDAVIVPGQECHQVSKSRPFDSMVKGGRFTVSRNQAGLESASMTLTGSSTVFTLGIVLQCESFTATGTPRRSPTRSAACGAEETAVGVLAFSTTDPAADCISAAGRDGIVLVMDDEGEPDHPYCSHDSGARGEGLWVSSVAEKYPPPACAKPGGETYLGFCRVDGALFKPVTSDPGRPEQSYAVLKLGDRCPDGSVEVKKRIDTDDVPAMQNKNSWTGVRKNSDIGTGFSTYVVLSFCYYTSAPTAAGVMRDFPDLGFNYAVFHDFEGPQPAWVVSKRWHFSDNQDSSANFYVPSEPGGFEKMVENTAAGDTYFDMARVR